LSVIDNFLLGAPGHVRLDRNRARRSLAELADQFGFKIDPDALVSSLSLGERQQLEIVRLLSMGVSLLILDEPTTAISAQQKDKLFAVLRSLVEQGKTILFVSHKLEEVKELCGRVTVLARGRVMGECEMPCPVEKLVEMMFGRTITPGKRSAMSIGKPVYELSRLFMSDWRLEVKDFSLEVRSGEVIGLAGLEGSGQNLFLKACAGLIKPKPGCIRIRGRDMTGRPYHQFLEAGVAYLPAGRLEEGLIAGMTLTEHTALMEHHPPFWVNWTSAAETASRCIQEFKIRGHPATPVENLSGGNQQRALLSLLPPHSRILLMEHPTRGLDLESADYIWEIMLNRARQGTVILFISSDVDELLERSHRIVVFFSGRFRVLETHQLNRSQLGESIGGWSFE
jgi:simple sugar transport system ATP-binding protein